MANVVAITPVADMDCAEITLAEIPDQPGDGYTVAAEASAMCQRAYEIGRRHQMAIVERSLHDIAKGAR